MLVCKPNVIIIYSKVKETHILDFKTSDLLVLLCHHLSNV